MTLALALTLLFAAPPTQDYETAARLAEGPRRSGPERVRDTADPFTGLSSGPAAMFTDYVQTQHTLKRQLEVVAVREKDGTSRAVLLDRTGCLRGWVVLTATAPTEPGMAPEFGAFERIGDHCDRPTPMSHFARLQDAIARRDPYALGAFFARDALFPVGLEAKGPAKRTTWSGADVTALKVELPLCDLLDESVTCSSESQPDLSGSVPNTCECVSPTRKLVYELRELSDGPGAPTIQVTSIREKRVVPKPSQPVRRAPIKRAP